MSVSDRAKIVPNETIIDALHTPPPSLSQHPCLCCAVCTQEELAFHPPFNLQTFKGLSAPPVCIIHYQSDLLGVCNVWSVNCHDAGLVWLTDACHCAGGFSRCLVRWMNRSLGGNKEFLRMKSKLKNNNNKHPRHMTCKININDLQGFVECCLVSVSDVHAYGILN